MSPIQIRLGVAIGLAAALQCDFCTGPVQAQLPLGSANRLSNQGLYPGPSGGGGQLLGMGEYLKARQEAFLIRERVRQARIETRRLAGEQGLRELAWEREALRMRQENREYIRQEQIHRVMAKPEITELTSGHALNVLLGELKRRRRAGEIGPGSTLPAEVIRALNMSPEAGPPAQLGVLKHGILDWPNPLAGQRYAQHRRAVEQSLRDAMDDLDRYDSVRPATRGGLRDDFDALKSAWSAGMRAVSLREALEAKGYLDRLEESIRALADPAALERLRWPMLVGSISITELVDRMAADGLRFAAAMPGEEGAYGEAHRAMAAHLSEVMGAGAE